MVKQKNNSVKRESTAANLGFEAKLWQAADTLRGSMDAAEYKHVVLGLIFLKYVSDAFEELHARLEAERAQGADPEDPDEYRAQNVFWVPPEARWAHLKHQAKQPTIGRLVDDAMEAVERDNPTLKGVLPKDYARPELDKQRLGQLIDLISNIRVGDEESRSKDILGRVYEYFLSQFASAEGKKGGEFYTPRCIVRLLVEMIEPFKGRVYDPCCGSAGMFVQSMEFIRAHASGNNNGGKAKGDISIYGQESNYTTWRLAKMNLAIRGIDGRTVLGEKIALLRRMFERHLGLPEGGLARHPRYRPEPVWETARTGESGQAPGGYFVWTRFDVDPQEIRAMFGSRVLGHELTGNGWENLKRIILGTGILAAQERRLQMGAHAGSTMSPGQDQSSGGAAYVFLRVGEPGKFHIEWDPNVLLERSDWFFRNTDNFGATNPDDPHWTVKPTTDPGKAAKATAGNNEICFKNGIGLFGRYAPRRIRAGKRWQEVLSWFKQAGITHLGGRPVEEVVV